MIHYDKLNSGCWCMVKGKLCMTLATVAVFIAAGHMILFALFVDRHILNDNILEKLEDPVRTRYLPNIDAPRNITSNGNVIDIKGPINTFKSDGVVEFIHRDSEGESSNLKGDVKINTQQRTDFDENNKDRKMKNKNGGDESLLPENIRSLPSRIAQQARDFLLGGTNSRHLQNYDEIREDSDSDIARGTRHRNTREVHEQPQSVLADDIRNAGKIQPGNSHVLTKNYTYNAHEIKTINKQPQPVLEHVKNGHMEARSGNGYIFKTSENKNDTTSRKNQLTQNQGQQTSTYLKFVPASGSNSSANYTTRNTLTIESDIINNNTGLIKSENSVDGWVAGTSTVDVLEHNLEHDRHGDEWDAADDMGLEYLMEVETKKTKTKHNKRHPWTTVRLPAKIADKQSAGPLVETLAHSINHQVYNTNPESITGKRIHNIKNMHISKVQEAKLSQLLHLNKSDGGNWKRTFRVIT